MGRLHLAPISLADANAFVARHHRHHKPVVGHKFSLCAYFDGDIVGVAIIGRPVARMRDNGETLEVTRLCTDGIDRVTTDRRGTEHTLGICSFLYGAAARAAFALGYRRIGTYILASETGMTLAASGWREIGKTSGGSWSRPDRLRSDKHPTEPKTLFQLEAA